MITGRVRRAVIDANDVTINLGRTRRLFTGKARQAAQLLAITCTHRGCDIPANLCDIDHRAEWNADIGTTDQHNAMPMCGVHDRWKHTNHIRSRRATNGRVYLIKPDGSTIKPVGETEPEWAEPEPVGSTPPTPTPHPRSPKQPTPTHGPHSDNQPTPNWSTIASHPTTTGPSEPSTSTPYQHAELERATALASRLSSEKAARVRPRN